MPPYCPSDAPPGERTLFEALAAAENTEGWIVLHSLAIASHIKQVQGEADFLVLVPELGMVAIEVKSHLSVRRLADGRWQLGKQPPTTRSPFVQSSEALHSIRQYLIDKGVSLRSIPFLNAVWFTHVRARAQLPPSPEWHAWQLLDLTDLESDPAASIQRTLSLGADHLKSRIPGFAQDRILLDSDAALRIASTLRPRFEVAIAPSDLRRSRETQLASFIDEQYDALDNMQENRAVLFTGLAGSGKTWLALEAARREVEIGRQGRLLCYNRLLGRRLKDETEHLPRLRTGTFHQEALRLSRLAIPSNADSHFWDHEVPEAALASLIDSGDNEALDFLIVDEAQDLASEQFLDVLDLLVKGGLRDGRVLFFGDFERQAIYDSNATVKALRKRAPSLISYRLTVNCRNLPRIGTVVSTLSGLTPGYRRFRRDDDGVNPSFITFQSGDDQSIRLVQAIQQLKNDGFRLDEIVVLSPLDAGSTAESTTDPWLRQVLQPADGHSPRPGKLRYSTIHAFKGLDAPAVVVTDLEQERISNFSALLYIALTRATDRLIALVEKNTLRTAYGGI